MSPNLKAFLDMLAFSEGTDMQRIGEGYDVLCGGARFYSYATHPALAGWRGFPLPAHMCRAAGFNPGCVSTAAGRYQINRPTFAGLVPRVGRNDFAPEVQDYMATVLIGDAGGIAYIEAGDLEGAIARVRRIWASLPGAGYSQHEHVIATLQQVYVQAGGSIG